MKQSDPRGQPTHPEPATLLLLVKPFERLWIENSGQNNDEPLGYEGELL